MLAIRDDTIRCEGGIAVLRDPGLLESAVMMPRQKFGGAYLHPNREAMAAAYLYHLTQNMAFSDANRRIAAMAVLVFLHLNGMEFLPPPEELERVVLEVADGSMSKAALTRWVEFHATMDVAERVMGESADLLRWLAQS